MTNSRLNQGRLTYADLESLPNDGKRYEIIAGRLFVNGSPSTYHQRVSRRLQHQLYTQIELAGHGEVFDAPMDVVLDAHDVVEPDLIVILRAQLAIITPENIQGVPALLVEILSPSTRAVDRGDKHRLYERSGVPEYWVVDPEARAVDRFVLGPDGYGLAQRCTETIEFGGVPGVRVDLLLVW
jgi:Uma2 family endonuclease